MKELEEIVMMDRRFTLAFITISFLTSLFSLFTVLKVLELVNILKEILT